MQTAKIRNGNNIHFDQNTLSLHKHHFKYVIIQNRYEKFLKTSSCDNSRIDYFRSHSRRDGNSKYHRHDSLRRSHTEDKRQLCNGAQPVGNN